MPLGAHSSRDCMAVGCRHRTPGVQREAGVAVQKSASLPPLVPSCGLLNQSHASGVGLTFAGYRCELDKANVESKAPLESLYLLVVL